MVEGVENFFDVPRSKRYKFYAFMGKNELCLVREGPADKGPYPLFAEKAGALDQVEAGDAVFAAQLSLDNEKGSGAVEYRCESAIPNAKGELHAFYIAIIVPRLIVDYRATGGRYALWPRRGLSGGESC